MLILHHGHFITCNPLQPFAEAVAIQDDRVFAIGSNSDILALSGRGSQIQDLSNQTVIPGLTDSHIHFEEFAFTLNRINCETPTKSDCLQLVKSKAEKSRPGQWILGHGWNHNSWGGQLPSADELDVVAPQNPVYLTGKSMHLAWVNHCALETAAVLTAQVDPSGGRIDRDSHGEPSGILMDNALTLIEKAIPIPPVEECIVPFQAAQIHLNRLGITAIHDFDDLHCFEVLDRLHSAGELHLHVIKGLPHASLGDAIVRNWKTGTGDDWLQIGSLKLFADGALGSKTALMISPYEGSHSETGLALLSEQELIDVGEKAITSGISLAIHAIGDQANRVVINALEQLREFEKEYQLTPASFRIEHVQLLDPVEIPRIAKSGIVASMQPIHATSDAAMADRLWGNRVDSAYAWKSILDSGAQLIFGSDCPVENPDPFWGIHAAVTRQPREIGAMSWHAEQCISFTQALQAYTTKPAVATKQGDRLGMLKQGCYADMVLLSNNPMTTPSNELYNIKTTAVLLAGKWLN